MQDSTRREDLTRREVEENPPAVPPSPPLACFTSPQGDTYEIQYLSRGGEA